MITLPNGWKQISNNILVHNEIEPIHYTCVWALLFYLIKSDMYSWKQMDCTLHAWNLDMLKLTVDKDWHVLIHLVFTLILDRMKEQMRLQENIHTVKPLCPLWHLQFIWVLEDTRYLLCRSESRQSSVTNTCT